MASLLETYNDDEETLRQAFDTFKSTIWTTMPGIIDTYNPEKMTARLRVAILGKIVGGSFFGGAPETKDFPLPLLSDVPVVFPHGGNVAITWPLVEGDSVLIHFASRCIDNWWLQGDDDGNPVPQIDYRIHHISDCFCVPGPFSQKNKLSNLSTNKLQIRSKDGSTYVELDPAGQIVNIVAPGGINITGNVTITGTVDASGIIKSADDVKAGDSNISLKTHKHLGVTTGTGTSGLPTT